MRHDISFDGVRERDRFEAWAETARDRIGVASIPPPDASGSFAARGTLRVSGPLMRFDMTADAHQVQRGQADIARRPWDSYWLYHESGAGAWFRLGGREVITRAGDLIVADTHVPFETRPIENYRHEVVMLPKALLDPHLSRRGSPLSVVLSQQGSLGALAADYFDGVARRWDGLPETAMASLADTLGRLIGIACGAAPGEHAEAVREARLARVKQHINLHLADPDLSPATAAAAMGLSVRSLHLAFEPTGTSFTRHVLRRRLEECHAALRADPRRPVLDIALAWGFGGMSSFYSAFQTAFGMSPRDVRAMGDGVDCVRGDAASRAAAALANVGPANVGHGMAAAVADARPLA